MSAVWTCYDCDGAEHPGEYRYCPRTGSNRLTAALPTPTGVPRSWRARAAAWEQFKAQLDDLDDEELRCAGLVRVTEGAPR